MHLRDGFVCENWNYLFDFCSVSVLLLLSLFLSLFLLCDAINTFCPVLSLGVAATAGAAAAVFNFYAVFGNHFQYVTRLFYLNSLNFFFQSILWSFFGVLLVNLLQQCTQIFYKYDWLVRHTH